MRANEIKMDNVGKILFFIYQFFYFFKIINLKIFNNIVVSNLIQPALMDYTYNGRVNYLIIFNICNAQVHLFSLLLVEV